MLMRDCSAMRQTLALSVCTEQRVAQIQSEAGEGPALLLHCRHGRSRGVSVANFCKVVITGSSLMRIKQGQAALGTKFSVEGDADEEMDDGFGARRW